MATGTLNGKGSSPRLIRSADRFQARFRRAAVSDFDDAGFVTQRQGTIQMIKESFRRAENIAVRSGRICPGDSGA